MPRNIGSSSSERLPIPIRSFSGWWIQGRAELERLARGDRGWVTTSKLVAISDIHRAVAVRPRPPRSTRDAKAGGFNLRLLGVAKLTTRHRNPCVNIVTHGGKVNLTAVLAMGFEPIRADAQRIARPSRLPISPHQHQFRRRTMVPRGQDAGISQLFRAATDNIQLA